MEDRIAKALTRLFDENRIVFWYDAKRELRAKLTGRKEHLEQISISGSASSRDKTAAYPLATQRIEIDLDDGVKVNYNKFGKALKKIKGLSKE